MIIKLSPFGLYQITRQSQAEFSDKRLLLADFDKELFDSLRQAFVMSKTVTELVDTCDNILYKRMENHLVSDALLLASTVISDSHGQVFGKMELKTDHIDMEISYHARKAEN